MTTNQLMRMRYPQLNPDRHQPKQIGTKTTMIDGREYTVRVFEAAGFKPSDEKPPMMARGGTHRRSIGLGN